MRLGGTSKHIEENPSRTYVIVTVSCMWGDPKSAYNNKATRMQKFEIIANFCADLNTSDRDFIFNRGPQLGQKKRPVKQEQPPP